MYLFSASKNAEFTKTNMEWWRKKSTILLLYNDDIDGASQSCPINTFIELSEITNKLSDVLHSVAINLCKFRNREHENLAAIATFFETKIFYRYIRLQSALLLNAVLPKPT